MRKYILTFMFVLMAFMMPLQAQNQNQKLKLAVYATGNIDALLKNIAQNNASTELVNCGRYQMIERSAEFLRFVSEEQNYQRSGAVDDNQIAELGKYYGADCVCVVDITHVDSYLYVATRMIDVTLSTSQRAGDAENTNYSSPVDLRKTVTAAVEKMEGINTGNSYPPAYNNNGKSVYRTFGDGSLKNAVFSIYGESVLTQIRDVFYDDGRSAKETAKIIDNRVQLYLDEQG